MKDSSQLTRHGGGSEPNRMHHKKNSAPDAGGKAGVFDFSGKEHRDGKTSIPHRRPDIFTVILAGGEGKRLQPLVSRLRGDALPKQFVDFTGRGSLLEHTWLRATRLVPEERIFTVINCDHFKHAEARRQVAGRRAGTVIVQPENKETGLGLLLSLMHIHKRSRDSLIVTFPSDHFVLGQKRLVRHVQLACRIVAQDPRRLILLGIVPQGPDPEYGYIVPGLMPTHLASWPVYSVSQFIEKPSPSVAQSLFSDGALWNTMIMVFSTKGILQLMQRQFPVVCGNFRRVYEAIGSPFEKAVVQDTYGRTEALNFSRDVVGCLTRRYPSRFLALPVNGVYWSDWGTESRILETLKLMRQPFKVRKALFEGGLSGE